MIFLRLSERFTAAWERWSACGSDFFVFPSVKKILRWKHFESAEAAVEAFIEAIEDIPASEWRQCFENGSRWMQLCIDTSGDYFERCNVNFCFKYNVLAVSQSLLNIPRTVEPSYYGHRRDCALISDCITDYRGVRNTELTWHYTNIIRDWV